MGAAVGSDIGAALKKKALTRVLCMESQDELKIHSAFERRHAAVGSDISAALILMGSTRRFASMIRCCFCSVRAD